MQESLSVPSKTSYVLELSCHLQERKLEFLETSQRIFSLSLSFMEYSSRLENGLHDLHYPFLTGITNILENSLEPLWTLNEEITDIYNDLSNLYNNLLHFSIIQHEKDILDQFDQRLKDLKSHNIKLPSLDKRIPGSCMMGKSVIAVLKEHCLRLNIMGGNSKLNEFTQTVKLVGDELRQISDSRLLIAKKWVKNAISDLDNMQCRLDLIYSGQSEKFKKD